LPDEGDDNDPSRPLEANELADSIDSALEELPANYREVLEPYLLRGERPVDIARARGKSPGTVRVQIRRGLAELRRALPAGLTLGTGLLVGERSLGQVRVEVLRRATLAAPPSAALSATSLSSTTLLGGLAMSNKIALGVIALTLVLAIGWVAQRDDAAPAEGPGGRASISLEDSRGTEAVAKEPGLPAASAGAQAAEVERVPITSSPDAARAADTALTGATGRVVDELGAAVPDVAVHLFELPTSLFDPDLGAPFQGALERGLRAASWSPIAAQATTDEEGRFSLHGADASAAHALGIDIGGPRPTLRAFERRLRPGGTTDLGTFQLEPSRRLAGRVLDASGAPVAGARLRVGDFPEPAHVLAGWRAGGVLIVGDDRQAATFELPAVLTSLIERLPVPTASTDTGGRFELEGAPVGPAQIFVDHPDHDWLVAQAPGNAEDLGDLQFAATTRFSGRVVDQSGVPVAGAQVRSGPGRLINPRGDDRIAVVSTETNTDAGGSFTLRSAGPPMIAARRGPSAAWTIVSHFLGAQDIVLRPTSRILVGLSTHDGEPVESAELSIVSVGPLSKLEDVLGAAPSEGVIEALGEGRYQIGELLPNKFSLRVRAEGFALRTGRLRIEQEETEVEWILDRTGQRRVQVIDLESRSPIAGARLSLLLGGREGGVLARTRTDGKGFALLEGVPVEGDSKLELRVAHPAYATSTEIFDARRESTTVTLSDASSALFTLSVLGSAPFEALMISLEASHSRGDDASLPLLQLSDKRGEALFERLPAGSWRYSVTTRFLDTDLLTIFSHPPAQEPLAEGEFQVLKGERARVLVDLSPEFFEQSAPSSGTGVEGRITLVNAGSPVLLVGLIRSGSWELIGEWLSVGPSGEYSITAPGPGEYQVIVAVKSQTDSPDFVVLASRELALARGRMLREDIELEGSPFTVAVYDETGAPATDAVLIAAPMEIGRDQPLIRLGAEAGLFEVVSWQSGPHFLRAASESAGIGSTEIEVQGAGEERFELRLSRGVPCAGRFQLPEGVESGQASFGLRGLEDDGVSSNGQLEFENGTAEFDLIGLPPGVYTGHLFLASMNGKPLSLWFELPPGGDRGLVVVAGVAYSGPAPEGARWVESSDD
jgi:protocatechuate 3,4-dioxygenase beta subunit